MPELVDIRMPESQEGTEAVVLTWFKQPGEAVEIHEPVLEINTDKVAMEVAAPASGILHEQLKGENDPVVPGEVLGRIEVGVTDAPEAPQPDTAAEASPAKANADRRPRLSPLVKRMLREHELDANLLLGTGRDGRITHRDVLAHLEQAQTPTPPSQPVAGGNRMIPHTPMRRRIASHMVESMLHTAPHVTAVFDADMTAVVGHRMLNKGLFAERGARLTYTAYFVAAAAQALQAVPEVNSRWHDDALEVFEDLNIGIATALGKDGLIVPVIKQAQNLGLFGIAKHLQNLTERARAGRLTQADVQGGTFTITNHGTSGSLLATPVINQPQSAILGIGKLEKRVVVLEDRGRDSLHIMPRIYVTLTIDHRALDGFIANLFLTKFVEALEAW